MDSPGKDLMWVIAIFAVIGLVWYATGGIEKYKQSSDKDKLYIDSPLDGKATGTEQDRVVTTIPIRDNVRESPYSWERDKNGEVSSTDPNASKYFGLITIDHWSGPTESSANREYVAISAQDNLPSAINVSGWRLKNDGENRYSFSNGNKVKGQPITVSVPLGIKLYSTTGANRFTPIMLEPGGKVVVLTGSAPTVSPVVRDSFLINKCSGYIDGIRYHQFYPGIRSNCPSSSSETDINALDSNCYDTIKYRYGSSCRTPLVENDPKLGTVLDGESFNNQCSRYILSHFTYESCVANHKTDNDFYTKEWRVFLNRPFEIWANDRETITLYDNEGKVVDQLKY